MLVRNAIDIGLIIRERRRKLNLDQGDLARQVRVSRQWIVEVEKGKPRAEISLVLQTLQALGIALSVDESQVGHSPTGAAPSVDIDQILDDLGSQQA